MGSCGILFHTRNVFLGSPPPKDPKSLVFLPSPGLFLSWMRGGFFFFSFFEIFLPKIKDERVIFTALKDEQENVKDQSFPAFCHLTWVSLDLFFFPFIAPGVFTPFFLPNGLVVLSPVFTY